MGQCRGQPARNWPRARWTNKSRRPRRKKRVGHEAVKWPMRGRGVCGWAMAMLAAPAKARSPVSAQKRFVSGFGSAAEAMRDSIRPRP